MHHPYRNIAIVGCGTLGSFLSLYLFLLKDFNLLFIFDFDEVSKKDEELIPMFNGCSGLKKVYSLDNYIRMINNNNAKILNFFDYTIYFS